MIDVDSGFHFLLPSPGRVLRLLWQSWAAGGRLVPEMNALAEALSLADTHFANPHGLDAEGHYSTARDLARLMASDALLSTISGQGVSIQKRPCPLKT